MVTSPSNPRIVAVRRLRLAKERAATRTFLLEGPRTVVAALNSDATQVREVFVTPEAVERWPDLAADAARLRVPVTVVAERVFSTFADTLHPQGVVAVIGMPQHDLDGIVARRPHLVAVLVDAADPGNAGTVIRTADAAGAAAVVLTTGSVDPYGGKCVRASAGSILHLPIVTGLDVAVVVEQLRTAGLTVLAAAGDGEPITDVGAVLAGPVAWLFGAEAHGLSDETRALADRTVAVPIYGRAESLNLAAAAAVCLYSSALAQRR